ncbi:uncharacterized protein LOC132883499 [Neoarius graeffei]|uniref:uncharacterized protein LOC132883499 n=1 Tax=Neoarius graeffei TaxID=443677 RepID=UPI00298D457D|nr:uncharacterized protein LOC132883499 [Neoarius graeffei]
MHAAGIMRSQLPVFLRALYLLLCMAPVFHGESDSQNNTTITMRTTEHSTNATESASPKTTLPIITTTFTTKTHDIPRTNIMSSESTPLPTTRARSDSTPTTTTPSSDAGTVVCVILFFVILIIVLFICTYKWYIRQGRPSFPEIQRHIAESVRNAWAATMECLRQSSKEEEEEEEMEAGISEAEQQKEKEDAEDEDEEDDSSADYSSMDGTVMMEKPKKDEQEDGQSNEREEDMTTIELMDEKMEKEKDDLTVL